ncbi:hypothetical protein HFN80_33210 [Rhizobium laguerreae]|nr:hypothetical protein [Rhizobium laguerreae]MBY3468778.1 hypothetical protein [Rhizobium laguerreae]
MQRPGCKTEGKTGARVFLKGQYRPRIRKSDQPSERGGSVWEIHQNTASDDHIEATEIVQISRQIDRAISDRRRIRFTACGTCQCQRRFATVNCNNLALRPGQPRDEPAKVTVPTADIENARSRSDANALKKSRAC